MTLNFVHGEGRARPAHHLDTSTDIAATFDEIPKLTRDQVDRVRRFAAAGVARRDGDADDLRETLAMLGLLPDQLDPRYVEAAS